MFLRNKVKWARLIILLLVILIGIIAVGLTRGSNLNIYQGHSDSSRTNINSSAERSSEVNRYDDSQSKSGANDDLKPDAKIALDTVQIDKVFVQKSTRTMQLLSHGKVIRSYHIALGDHPKGQKQRQGDERTPEGIYTLDYKNENSIAYRSIHISYPNEQDIAQAQVRGEDPGGAIMIHGQMNGFGEMALVTQQRDWTDGCIAVTNEEMDEIMATVKIGTPIEIIW